MQHAAKLLKEEGLLDFNEDAICVHNKVHSGHLRSPLNCSMVCQGLETYSMPVASLFLYIASAIDASQFAHY